MKVFITVETLQGVVHDAKVFVTEKSARLEEAQWLSEQGIKSQDVREDQSDRGTEFLILEADLKP